MIGLAGDGGERGQKKERREGPGGQEEGHRRVGEGEREEGFGGEEQTEKRRRNSDQRGTRGTFSVNLVFPYSWMIFWLGYSVSLIVFFLKEKLVRFTSSSPL